MQIERLRVIRGWRHWCANLGQDRARATATSFLTGGCWSSILRFLLGKSCGTMGKKTRTPTSIRLQNQSDVIERWAGIFGTTIPSVLLSRRTGLRPVPKVFRFFEGCTLQQLWRATAGLLHQKHEP